MTALRLCSVLVLFIIPNLPFFVILTPFRLMFPSCEDVCSVICGPYAEQTGSGHAHVCLSNLACRCHRACLCFDFKGIFTLSHTNSHTQLLLDKNLLNLCTEVCDHNEPFLHADAVTLKTSTHTDAHGCYPLHK